MKLLQEGQLIYIIPEIAKNAQDWSTDCVYNNDDLNINNDFQDKKRVTAAATLAGISELVGQAECTKNYLPLIEDLMTFPSYHVRCVCPSLTLSSCS